MNILKSTRVLDRNCLRGKIQGLSPLLRTVDWPPSRDSVFRATWSYYANGCQERLTGIRRRIEQNARIVAPNREPITQLTQLTVALKLPGNGQQLPPGIDLDEHIYQELVSCFRNARSTLSRKKTSSKRSKVQKYFKMGKFSTPEQWHAWKRQELQVDQLLQNSYDPYLREEMHKKLHRLQKLTKLQPLVLLPNQEENNIEKHKVSVTRKRKSRQKSINKPRGESESRKNITNIADIYRTHKKPSKTSKIENLSSRRSTKSVHSKHSSGKSTTSTILAFHPSLESIVSSRRSTRSFRPYVKRTVKSNHSSEEDGIFGIDYQGEAPLLNEDTTSAASRRLKKKAENSHIPKKIKKHKLIKERKNTEKARSETPKLHEHSKHPKTISQHSLKIHSELDSTNVSFLKSKKKASKERKFGTMARLRKSKSEGTIKEAKSEELRQSLVSKSMSQLLSKLPTPNSSEYIAQIFKGLPSNDASLIRNLKNKFNESVVSLYRGQITNSDNGSEIREIQQSFVRSGDHHGWTFGGKNLAFVKPTSYPRISVRQRDPHEVAEKNIEIEAADDTALNSIIGTQPIARTAKEQDMRLQSKTISVDEDRSSVEAKPLLISDLISEFMLAYGSKISFFETYPDLFKSNNIETYTTANVKEVPKQCTRKRKVKKVKDVKRKPSQHFKKTCSLCNCVRRKRSELQPYMQRMQRRRQRLELKTYYTQRISKCRENQKQPPMETCTREGLAMCYQALSLCQQIVEQKLSQRSDGCQMK